MTRFFHLVWGGLALAAGATLGAIAGFFNPGAWYGHIIKPDWAAAPEVFGPAAVLACVWLALASTVGAGGERVSRRVARGGLAAAAGVAYAAWGLLFFGLREPATALPAAALASLFGIALVASQAVRSPIRATLIAIPIAWFVYVAGLTMQIWRLNA